MIHARHEPIHVTVAAHADDPRNPPADIPGVVIHHAPELHPDDVTVVDGIPVTSVARTLVDLAEVMDAGELRATFARGGWACSTWRRWRRPTHAWSGGRRCGCCGP